MGKRDFDNLSKVIEGAVVLTGTTIVSLEIDLELPRGFIAKFYRIELRVAEFADDWRTISVDKNARINMAIVRDPDDTKTTTMQSNVVQHDVLADFEWEILIVAGTAGDPGIIMTAQKYVYDIPEHIDVISFRNLRFNAVADDDNAADITEAVALVQLFYTLEKVRDDDILELLDIL